MRGVRANKLLRVVIELQQHVVRVDLGLRSQVVQCSQKRACSLQNGSILAGVGPQHLGHHLGHAITVPPDLFPSTPSQVRIPHRCQGYPSPLNLPIPSSIPDQSQVKDSVSPPLLKLVRRWATTIEMAREGGVSMGRRTTRQADANA